MNKLGYEFSSGKVLFVTALNSIQMSMVTSVKSLGLECEAVTVDNYAEVLASDVKVLFVSPEVMKLPRISSCLLAHRASIILKVIDEAHLVVSWGLKKGDKSAFRPAMALTSGELSGVGGTMLFMTATATSRTVRILMDQLPEIKKWNLILNSPWRENATIVVPPPEILSPKFEVALEPFIVRMKELQEVYLILVRGILSFTELNICSYFFSFKGINKGSSIFLHLLRKLGDEDGSRRVAFYHRNTSEKRKEEILADLKLPLTCPGKKLLAVVATVSLGKLVCFIQLWLHLCHTLQQLDF